MYNKYLLYLNNQYHYQSFFHYHQIHHHQSDSFVTSVIFITSTITTNPAHLFLCSFLSHLPNPSPLFQLLCHFKYSHHHYQLQHHESGTFVPLVILITFTNSITISPIHLSLRSFLSHLPTLSPSVQHICPFGHSYHIYRHYHHQSNTFIILVILITSTNTITINPTHLSLRSFLSHLPTLSPSVQHICPFGHSYHIYQHYHHQSNTFVTLVILITSTNIITINPTHLSLWSFLSHLPTLSPSIQHIYHFGHSYHIYQHYHHQSNTFVTLVILITSTNPSPLSSL